MILFSTLLLPGALTLSPGQGTPVDVTIPNIQGRAHMSPLLGRRVRSRGIVTAVAGTDIYVQDPVGDDDPATSDAVALKLREGSVAPGDDVRFSGTVSEIVPGGSRTANLSTTTVDSAHVELLRRGQPQPRPQIIGRGGRLPPFPDVISSDELPVNLRDESEVRRNRFDPDSDAMDFFESLEGMRVVIRRPVAVSAIQTFNSRQSELVTLPDGGAGIEASQRTGAGGLLLQSGPENLGSQNPERVQVQLDSTLFPGPVPRVQVGDRLGDVTGILRYDFGNYEVAATQAFMVDSGGGVPDTTTLVGTAEQLTLATYNVLNLSATAEDSTQRRLLGQQIVRNLGSPDIIALQEIQDESGEADDGRTTARATLRELVQTIEDAGGPGYGFFDVPPADGRPGGAPGGNIRNAFLYNPKRVSLVSYRSLTPRVLAAAGVRDSLSFQESRDPLEGVFRFRGRPIRIVNNHLTSRFGSTPVFGAVQPFVQAGEPERGSQARALHRYVAQLSANDPGLSLAMVGDLNTFEFSDEVAEMLPGSPPILQSLWPMVQPSDRYTYNYEGNSQVLDHILVTRALSGGAELDVLHLNVDFPALPGATASDHDALVARLRP